MKTLFVVLAIVFAVPSYAQFRCNINGQVVFQETSCNAPGKKAVDVEKMSAAELQAHFEQSKKAASRPAQEPKGYELYLPSDQGATFVVLDVVKSPPDGRMREITTKRIGRAGHVSYSLRLYDCRYGQVKYLAVGDTYQSLKTLKPDPNMSYIVPGSIAQYVGDAACK